MVKEKELTGMCYLWNDLVTNYELLKNNRGEHKPSDQSSIDSKLSLKDSWTSKTEEARKADINTFKTAIREKLAEDKLQEADTNSLKWDSIKKYLKKVIGKKYVHITIKEGVELEHSHENGDRWFTTEMNPEINIT